MLSESSAVGFFCFVESSMYQLILVAVDDALRRCVVSFPRFFVCQRAWFMLPVFPDAAC
jgi:hypothetical protein